MPGYNRNGSFTNADTLRCPVMNFPTMPDRFATPFGNRALLDNNKRCGLHA